MVFFSPSAQAFYLTDELINDGIQIEDDVHFDLLKKINDGFYIFTDLTYSDPRPSLNHVWNGAAWIDNRTAEEIEAERLKQFTPLTRRQFKLALLEHSLLETVERTIAAIEDPSIKTRIQIEYNESERFERSNESVQYMLSLLSLTAEQVDEMWLYAATL